MSDIFDQVDIFDEVMSKPELSRQTEAVAGDPAGIGMGDYVTKGDSKSFVNRYIRPVTEGAGLIMGTGIGSLVGPAGIPVGGGFGFDIGSQTADQLSGDRPFWKMYTPDPGRVELGATYAMGGPVLSKLFPKMWDGAVNALSSLRRGISSKLPWTEAGVQRRAGNELIAATGENPQYGVNALATEQLEKEIPGYKASLGERTGDPGLIKKQRSMERQPGGMADKSVQMRAENQDAVRSYVDKQFPGGQTVDDLVESLTKRRLELEQGVKSSTERVGTARDKLPVRSPESVDPQKTGRTIVDEIETQRRPAREAVREKYGAIPNERFQNVEPLSKTVEELEKDFRPGDEAMYPSSAVDHVKTALKKSKDTQPGPDMILGYDKAGKPVRQADVDRLSAKSMKTGVKIESPIVKGLTGEEGVGFQDLHSLRKDLGRQIRSSMSDPNKLDLTRRLRILKGSIDDMIDSEMSGKELYDDARKAYIEYAQRFKTGEVAKIRQPGNESTGLRIPSAQIGKRIFTPDGADDFIRAVGKDKAMLIAEEQAANDLMSSNVVDRSTGEIKTKAFESWFSKKKPVLDKYGITSDFESIQSAQSSLEVAKDRLADFDKSVAGRILGSDPEKAIASAFKNSGNKTGQTMFDLMKRVGNDENAVRGLQNAFKDFLVNETETTAATVAGDRVLSPASIVKAMEKYRPAMKILYENDPKKLEALVNVQRAIETSARSLKSPLGGGSDTSENIASGLGHYVMSSVFAKVPGVGLSVKLGSAGLGALNRLGAKDLDRLLVRAMYDPDLARTLMNASRGNVAKETIEWQLDKHLASLGLYETMDKGPQKKEEPKEDIFSNLNVDDKVKPIEPGNINLLNRPIVDNNGKISTVFSMGIGIEDGKEVLIPRISDDGKIMTEDEAIDQFKKTGKHLGIFANSSDATIYANELHKNQEKLYLKDKKSFGKKEDR